MLPIPNFALHRARLLEALGEGEAVLLFGATHKLRNGDSDYRYRPDSDVYWLTGWEDPDCAVFIRRGDEPFVMFVQPKDKDREIWDGFRHGPDGAKAVFGADRAYNMSELEKELPKLIQGIHTLHYAFGRDAEHDALLNASITKAAKACRRSGLDVPDTFVSLTKTLHELRLHKGEDELEVMRHAAKMTAEAFDRITRQTRAGVQEYELEGTLLGTFRRWGSTGPGYTPIVAGGPGATTLHYNTNRRDLRDGELLLVDAGGEIAYYTADVTRTWPVSGRFTEVQRSFYEVVLKAQHACIAAIRPGATFMSIHDIAIRTLTEGMVELGLLKGEVDQLIKDETFKRYYMHGTSHWLGLDVHDVGAYGGKGTSRVLQPGMVLTVEPGLYVPEGDSEAPAHLRGLGVRIEDDVLVTATGHEVLTAAIPKEVRDLEALVGAGIA